MDRTIISKGKAILFVPLVALLVCSLSLNLGRAQQEDVLEEELQLASAELSEEHIGSPVISMDFQDADLKDVLKVFSQQAGLNFIASERIKDRKVTLYLDSVSVEDALDTIMTANNLTYEQRKDSVIFVVKELGRPEIETITRIFPLQYASVTGYELDVEGRDKSKKVGIKEVMEKILTENGKVIEDSRTNSLIITDVPSQFAKIDKTIKELDIKLPQVMIEAEIIEATIEAIDKLGIQWGSATEGALGAAFGAKRTDSFPFTKYTSPSAPTVTAGYISAENLGGTLAMLAKDTETKILARPKILTLNNETAEIKITAETAISSATFQSAAEGLATQTTTIERYETGVSLKVTPQINEAGEITMAIEPAVISIKASAILEDVSDPQERSAKTIVTVRDGETVIIGGLIRTDDTDILRKVPFFGDIPLLGNLFRKQDDSSTDKELIIFITPHLAKEGARAPGLALEKQVPWEYSNLGLKEETMERILDRLEE